MEDQYQQALDFLYGYINFEKNPLERYQASKIDTDRPRQLLAFLGDPHQDYPAIHIAGTKGKGSVAAMAAASLQAAGLTVGLYTSPHLREFRERIRVLTPDDRDGRITPDEFVACMEQVRAGLDEVTGITWFEIVTAIAFLYFSQRQVDVAVIEVGLGGRLDATNVVTPEVSVITTLSLDHTQLLGDTLAQIAYEKGGIIKPGVPVVTASQKPEALTKLKEICDERGAPITVIGEDWQYQSAREKYGATVNQTLIITAGPDPAFIPPDSAFRVALAGEHQLENAAVALAALEQVWEMFPTLTLEAMQIGLASAHWDGRLQVLQEGDDKPMVLVDCAHNVDSTTRLAEALLNDYTYKKLILIFGAPADKNITQMMTILFPLADAIIVTTSHHPRSATPAWLSEEAARLGFATIQAQTIGEALTMGLEMAGPGDLLCTTGSIIVVGDLLNQWDDLQSPTI
ncbi:MAG: folylpolyglutamate synthase/dihydrofolate synthase family protein [Chloroflexota bacterium]